MIDIPAITIISGGQTGADRAALDFAIDNGISHAGWCPRGRLSEDGRIPERYELRETPSRQYVQRTEWNVRDSDATVVFTMATELKGGTALTVDLARRLSKPLLHLAYESLVSIHGEEDAVASASELLLAFIAEHRIATLNVAGPRASQEPQVAGFVYAVLRLALTFPSCG